MAGILVGAAVVGIVGSVAGGLIGMSRAKKDKEAAEREKAKLDRQIRDFENNRQAIINPYSDVTSLSGMVDEMRDSLSNPYANLGVATGAAEIQMEQTDIALANTLDTLQSTGASAGGATALAQAARASKKDVAANIQQQEAQNEKLRAQGEESLQAKEMQLTQMEMSEEARVQNAQAQGKAFMFGAQENRDVATLDRMSGQQSQARQDIANANMAEASAMSGMISGVTSSVSGIMGSGAFAKGGTFAPTPA